MKLGIKLFTYPKNRSVGYSLFYMIFYISGAIASGIFDGVRTIYSSDSQVFNIMFFACTGMYAAVILLSLTIRNLDIEESGETELELNMSQNGWDYIKEEFVKPDFWRFFSLVLLLSVVKSMYTHIGMTLPLYMDRSIHSRAHFSIIIAIHEIVLLIGIPLLTGLIRYFNSYSLLVIGSMITLVSPLVLLLGNSYVTLSIFVTILSIGESIYAPRLVDYTIEAAPKGKEAVYLAIGNIPNSLSLLIAGISSGLLMAELCPEDGEQKYCVGVWLSIAGYSLIPCLVVMLGKRLFQKRNINKD